MPSEAYGVIEVIGAMMVRTMTQEETIIWKTDVLGRVTMPSARREEVLDEYECSDMPAARFAKVHGINEQTFATWVQKRKKKRIKKQPLALVEAVVAEKSKDIKMELANGIRIEISDHSQLSLEHLLIKFKHTDSGERSFCSPH
ncbi:MAG: hypothetical protein AAGA64_15690 [Bacteroidota bacterium]